MPTTLTVYPLSRAGVDFTALAVAAASGGNNWPNTGNEFLTVHNPTVGAITVTLVPTKTTDDQAATGRTVVVPAGHDVQIGPFPAVDFNDANAKAGVTYSSVTNITVLVVKVN